MDSFRSLADLPDRVGFTSGGSRVQALPYSEGQLLVTLADDWTRTRLELQLHTFGTRVSVAAGGAGTFNCLTFRATTLPLRLTCIEGLNSSPLRWARSQLVLTPVSSVSAPQIEGPGTGLSEHTASLIVSTPVGNPLGLTAFVIRGGVSFHGDVLPRVLLPGEQWIFATDLDATVLDLCLAWEELPSSYDTLTSQAKDIPPTL